MSHSQPARRGLDWGWQQGRADFLTTWQPPPSLSLIVPQLHHRSHIMGTTYYFVVVVHRLIQSRRYQQETGTLLYKPVSSILSVYLIIKI